jgi:hypothetical protein
MGPRRLGLDELMIVNPGLGVADAVLLGDDGTLYRLRRIGTSRVSGRKRRCRRPECDCDYRLLGAGTRRYEVDQ